MLKTIDYNTLLKLTADDPGLSLVDFLADGGYVLVPTGMPAAAPGLGGANSAKANKTATAAAKPAYAETFAPRPTLSDNTAEWEYASRELQPRGMSRAEALLRELYAADQENRRQNAVNKIGGQQQAVKPLVPSFYALKDSPLMDFAKREGSQAVKPLVPSFYALKDSPLMDFAKREGSQAAKPLVPRFTALAAAKPAAPGIFAPHPTLSDNTAEWEYASRQLQPKYISSAEYVLGGIPQGVRQTRIGQEYAKPLFAQPSDANKLAAWLGQSAAYEEQKPGKIAGVLRKGMELVGQTGYTVINAADEAAMGAGTGAVAGALLAGSPTLGLGAAPGAISGALAGGGIGLKAGMAKEVFAMEAGYAYHELKSMGVDDQPAKQIAIAVGAANAAIEFAQIGTLLKGLGKAVPTGYVSRMIARRLLAKGAAGRSAAALAAMAVDAAKETLQELGQESVAIAGTEFGAQMQGVNGLGKEQIAARLKDTALSSALGFLFLNIPGAVYGAHAANLPVLPGKYAAGTGGLEGELRTANGTTDNIAKGVGKTVIGGVPKVRVGQWMSKAEYEQFVKTGQIPRTNVLTKGMDSYIKQANNGDFYVEFNIDSSLLAPKNEALGWSLIKPKNQMYIKLYQNKGLTLPDPIGTNIIHVYTK